MGRLLFFFYSFFRDHDQ
uniref:Uncharacterized protein n=1 Tax=Anguilla anguilla TaxID=7936 RepID=A0A0E9SMB6_ANGAN